MNRLYFYGNLNGIGILGLVLGIILFIVTLVIGNYFDALGCLFDIILCIYIIKRFSEKRALKDKRRC